MSWTYTNAPATVTLDALRLEIGDTNTADQQLSNEELNYLLTREGSHFGAAIAATRLLIAKFARLVDKSVGDLSLSYSQRLSSYSALLVSLTTQQALRVAGPIAGGLSKARKRGVELDADNVEPDFKRDAFEHPGTVADDPDTNLTS